MATISQLVTYQIPQTEADLLTADGLSDYAAIKTAAIDRAKAVFYVSATIPAEATMHDLVKLYLSDISVLALIDVAIDWYQSKTVLSQSQGSDENIRFYDRVESLRLRAEELRDRIDQAKALAESIAFAADAAADVAGIPRTQSQADSRVKITIDPWQYARTLYGDLIEIADGTKPLTIQVDRP